jgi:TPR repeat protein
LLQRAEAWGDLIFRFEHGLGTERDLVAAARYYCHAAMSNSRFYVQYSLADKMEFNPPKRSWGTPVIDTADGHVQIYGPSDDIEASDDVLRALSLYLKSATGDGSAALQIGNRYLAGQDAPKSATRAWVWFALAAQNGSTGAREKITGLESNMTGEELKAAKRLLADQIQELKKVAAAIPTKP